MADEQGTGLPASFELAWGVRGRPTRGPKAGLSLAKVVAAGVAVADAEDIGAVSMSRVGKELGTSAMSLYRYVATKDELLQLMVDEALGDIPEIAGDLGWRAGLESWARHELAAYRRHPWVLKVPIHGPSVTPKLIGFLEQGLRCLTGTPIEPYEKLAVMITLTSYTRSWATLMMQIGEALAAGEPIASATMMANYGKVLSALTTPAEFPALHEIIDSGAFDEEDEEPEMDFVFGLNTILDGIAARIAAGAR